MISDLAMFVCPLSFRNTYFSSLTVNIILLSKKLQLRCQQDTVISTQKQSIISLALFPSDDITKRIYFKKESKVSLVCKSEREDSIIEKWYQRTVSVHTSQKELRLVLGESDTKRFKKLVALPRNKLKQLVRLYTDNLRAEVPEHIFWACSAITRRWSQAIGQMNQIRKYITTINVEALLSLFHLTWLNEIL